MSIFPELDTWINGESEPSDLHDDSFLCDPNDGQTLQELRSSSPAQVERAIAAATAEESRVTWAGAGVDARGAVLHRLADLIDEKADEIAHLDSLNSGVPIRFTRLFASGLGGVVRSAVTLAEQAGSEKDLGGSHGPVRLRRVPWGPTALIMPWNAPAFAAVKKMAFALASGATVVAKPSSASPWSAQLIAKVVQEAGIPAGVFNMVMGGAPVGAQICSDDRIKAISMTGSTPTGRAIAAAAAPHFTRLHLELGSNNPAIVRHDARIEESAQSVYDGMTKLNGQWCEAPRIVYVARDVADEFIQTLKEKVLGATLGSSVEPSTAIGPMAFEARKQELEQQRDWFKAGGHDVVSAGNVPQSGWFFPPTIVVGRGFEMPGEVFGPMIAVEVVSNDREALDKANAGGGGLAAYVFSESEPDAFALGSRIVAGEVKINGTSVLDMAPDSAQSFFGGSGIGGHGDRDVFDFYSGKQVVGFDLVGAPM